MERGKEKIKAIISAVKRKENGVRERIKKQVQIVIEIGLWEGNE